MTASLSYVSACWELTCLALVWKEPIEDFVQIVRFSFNLSPNASEVLVFLTWRLTAQATI